MMFAPDPAAGASPADLELGSSYGVIFVGRSSAGEGCRAGAANEFRLVEGGHIELGAVNWGTWLVIP